MAYATAAQVAAGFRPLREDETARCTALLEEAGVIIDACAPGADPARKGVVSCRMVRRTLGDGAGGDTALYPMGATQGSASAMGYTQSWTMGGGSSGELYVSKLEKQLLGIGNRIGARSPLEGMCDDPGH